MDLLKYYIKSTDESNRIQTIEFTSKVTSLSKATIQKMRTELKEKGYLVTVKGSGTCLNQDKIKELKEKDV